MSREVRGEKRGTDLEHGGRDVHYMMRVIQFASSTRVRISVVIT